MRTISLDRIEKELDSGNISARARNGNLHSCRRGGRTKTWATKPGFRIPVKIGFRAFGEITEKTEFSRPGDGIIGDFYLNSMA